MADISSFKGIRYNPQKIKDISKVVAPPYDVISPAEQDKLHDTDPHNIIRILLGKDFPSDNDKDNKYTRAAKFLKAWQEQEILKRDEESSIYINSQEFDVDGKKKQRIGFIALLKLEDFDTEKTTIYPHENTLTAPKQDRTRLIRSIEANIGPIFAIFADEGKTIGSIFKQASGEEPIIDIKGPHGIRNRLWRIYDKGTIDRIIDFMKDKKIFIADGHHRYEVGLEFSKAKKEDKYGYILTYFTDIYSDGVVILPVHRLISGLTERESSDLEESLKKDFELANIQSKESAKRFLKGSASKEKRFVAYFQKRFIGMSFKDDDSLDVDILHNLVIEPLKMAVQKRGGKISIDFTKDFDYAINEVDRGHFSMSFMLNPTEITQVRDIALSGKRMPQKSTYFYPKVLSGLVINVF